MKGRQGKDLLLGLAFISPNVLGFMTFTLVPLIVSMVLAFSNWDLRLHNQFKDEAVRMVGTENFARLLDWSSSDFYRFLGNTLFLLIGLPLGITASLVSALLLSKDLRAGGSRARLYMVAGAGLVLACILLAASGAGASGMTIVVAGLAGLIFFGGVSGGMTVYRTLFYIPNFTAGVATMLLWKKLYDPVNGPITNALREPLHSLGEYVNHTGPGPWQTMLWVMIVLALLIAAGSMWRMVRQWFDSELGTGALVAALVAMLLPGALALAGGWIALPWAPLLLLGPLGVLAAGLLAFAFTAGRPHPCKPSLGTGGALLSGMGICVIQLILIGLGIALWNLPARAEGGLVPPQWLQDYHWAKPSLMFMGFWAAIGSQTMLLYLAALTNIPPELYEAAEIDGASSSQQFWNVTWPQLAPTTFFVVVMGMIGGLQGGFEAARVMTQGGPAGSTTTLAYYIYNEGFVTGRLGYASAIAWTMFIIVLFVTLLNWKFGNRYVNE